MAEEDGWQSPLGHLASALAEASSDRISMSEISFLAQVNLRGNAGDAAFLSAVEQCLGCALPTVPNRVTSGNSLEILWLGPDEWLVVGPEGTNEQLDEILNEALQGRHVAVVDVSAHRTVIELSGSKAREVLGKGCGLDFHPRSFGPGQCAQTMLAKAQVIVQQITAEPSYRIFVRNSFANYLAVWLMDAASEYRMAPPEGR